MQYINYGKIKKNNFVENILTTEFNLNKMPLLFGGDMLIKISEASKLSNIPETTIRDMIKDGRVKAQQGENERIERLEKVDFLQSIPTVITFFNQKGGVGKSTATVLFTDFLKKHNLKTLLVDLDPQASITDIYLKYDRDRATLYEHLENNTPLQNIVCKIDDNTDILPASLKMSRKAFIYESELLQHKEKMYSFFKKYQVIVVDCPPTMNSFSRFGVLLSNFIMIPLVAHPLCYDGLDEALRTIKNLREMNKDFIDYYGFMSMYEGVETSLGKSMLEEYKNGLKEKLFEEKIRKFIGFAERTAVEESIFELYKDKKPVEELEDLFKSMMKKVYDER